MIMPLAEFEDYSESDVDWSRIDRIIDSTQLDEPVIQDAAERFLQDKESDKDAKEASISS